MSDCIHSLNFCDECGGLEVTRWDRVPGVISIDLGDGPVFGAEVFFSPPPEPCIPPDDPQDPATA
ncbi:hypothetical protein [Streptomyces sp. NPDC054887]